MYYLQPKNSSIFEPSSKMTAVTFDFALPENITSQLPSRMIAIRKANGLTQAQVAKRLGITQGSYGHYERGIRRVSLEMLPKLAAALECMEADLIGVEPKRAKRGPLSGWERRIETIRQLPRNKQREIQNVIDALIEKAS